MLQNIRDNSQSLIVKVIIGLIIGVFALFGAESLVGGFFSNNPNTVATVNGTEISEQALTNNVQNLRSQMGDQAQSVDEQMFRELALNQLIEDRLLMQAAEDNGLAISDEAVDQRILQTEQFQVNGQFSRDLAMRTMNSQGYTPQTYRDALSQQMLTRQVASAYSGSAFVTQYQLERLAALQGQTRDFRYLSVPLGTRTTGESIPEEDLRSYYENNQQQFSRPEQVAIDYVVFDRQDLAEEISVSEERLREEYEGQREEADTSVERRAAHILLETGGDRSEEEALELAAELRQRIQEGESFAELAAEYSDDAASASNGGDIGFSSGEAFPQPIEDALVDMEEGELSEPIVSEFGVHLVRLTEVDRQEFESFEEARDRIEQELTGSQVEERYFQELETLGNLAFETSNLQQIAEELDLEIQQSEFFGRSGGNGPITGNDEVVEAAFSGEVLEESRNSEVIQLEEGRNLVLRVREHRPQRVPPFEEVRSEVATILRREREEERAREIGESLLTALRNGEDITATLEEEDIAWQEHEDVGRQQGNVNPEIRRQAFNMQAPPEEQSVRYQGSTLSNGAYVVIELQDVQPGSWEDFSEQERQQLTRTIVQQRGRRAFEALLAHLREEADITRNL